ncbi:MAG: hypothetical protein ACUVX1_05000 [Chloroflexota bacterium]
MAMQRCQESTDPIESQRRGIERSASEEISYAQDSQGVLILRGVRAAILPLPAFALLLQVIYEHAPEIIKYAFYDMGYRAGFALMEGVGELRQDPERAFRALVENYQRMGYGELEGLEFDLSRPEARLQGQRLFETEMAKMAGVYRSPRATSHYTCGMLAGFVSCLLGREVVCEEVLSEFRGDGVSEFVILPLQLQAAGIVE